MIANNGVIALLYAQSTRAQSTQGIHILTHPSDIVPTSASRARNVGINKAAYFKKLSQQDFLAVTHTHTLVYGGLPGCLGSLSGVCDLEATTFARATERVPCVELEARYDTHFPHNSRQSRLK